MTEKEFTDYVGEASKAAGKLLDAEPDVFRVEKTFNSPLGYNRRLSFGDQHIYLGIQKSAGQSYLLNMFIDTVAERVAIDRSLIESSSTGLFVSSRARPCLAQEWGEDLYRDVQNRIIQSFGTGLSLDIALINRLSAQRYEGAKCEGGLVFDSGQTTDVDALLSMPIEAAEKIVFQAAMLRQIRKLLAGSKDYRLVFRWDPDCQEYICKGYCRKAVANQFEWEVRFSDLLDWKFYHFGHPMFRFLHNGPKIIRDPITAVVNELKEEFPAIDLNAARLLLERGSRQSHGTALIFLDFDDPHIKKWIDRLYLNERAIRLVSCESAPDAVQSLSGLDGALLIDAHTMEVKYFTAIVDGRVSTRGDLSRGARHNSIHTFVTDLVSTSPQQASKAVAVVFSEDGGAVTIKGKNPQVNSA